MFGKDKKTTKKKKEPCLDCQLKIAESNERAAEAEEKLLRSAADLDNYKKRQEKEMRLYKKVTVQSILLDFLPVIDELDMAISAAPEKVADGLEMSKKGLLNKLAKHGVEPIQAMGKPFDANIHEGVMVMEREDHEENTVIAVVENGYMLGDFLLKPAKVVVSKKPDGGRNDEETF